MSVATPPEPVQAPPSSGLAGPDQAQQLLGLLERAAGAGSWQLQSPQAQLSWSARFAELLGLPADASLTLDQFLGFFAPESRDRMARALADCIHHAVPLDEEVQIITTAGDRLWVRTLGESMPDAGGDAGGMHGVLQDLAGKKRDERATHRASVQLNAALATIKEAFVTLDAAGRFTSVNREAEVLLGQPGAQLLGLEIWQVLDDQTGGRLRRELRAALASGMSVVFEEFCAPLSRWMELRAYPYEDGLAVYLRDISARRQSQEQLWLLQTSISRLNDIVLITEAGPVDAPGPRIVFVNDAFERQTGYSRDEVLGQSPRLLQGTLTQRAELARIRTALQNTQRVRAELINYKKNGDLFWLELEIVPVDYFSRGLTHWVAVGRDITERKAAADEIEHLAFYDALTQLPNRQLLMDRLRLALAHGDVRTQFGALMFIDLDHFKVLNDTLGHSKGDLLLQKVADRLSTCVRLSDTVARLGGDEFVVMLEKLSEDHDIATIKTRVVGEKILAALSEPYDLAGHQHHATCSIGMTLIGQQQESIGDLLKQADLAMYQAKAAGRNGLCFFDPEMQAEATANAALNSELRQSLRDNEFLLYYQPQVGREGRMLGVEALIRWNHPQRGLVPPSVFVTQAEESGLIMPLGQWVLETACAQLAEWAKRPQTEKLSIAINVSVRQFRHPQFVEQVMQVIEETGIRADRLKLELTETLLATDIEVTIAKMGMLKDAGVTLSIDDFGMGYSALSYLKHMPLDQLKIDRTFVKDVLTDPNDAAIARTIIGLAQSLGLAVLAEGVETEAQREFLARHGCENYQGYLFCAALPIDELETFMQGLPE